MNQSELAEAIERLQGEWAERFGGSLTVESKPWKEVAAANKLDTDVITFPSRYLGDLCVRDWLRPVRPNVLEGEDFDVDDLFPLVRHKLIRWGGQEMALPLGVDLSLVREPVDDRPAISLLVEAAPRAASNDRIGALFDMESMKPRITEPQFVDALNRLRKSNGNFERSESNSALRVPVLGFDDRFAAVTTTSRNAASAFKLLAWLASPDISSRLSRAGPSLMPVRRSLASSPAWYDPSLTAAERADLGKLLQSALSGQLCLLIPSIPGIDEYVSALDRAVKAAVSGDVASQAALEEAAKRWDEITSSHGRDAQQAAYLKHLGIGD